MAEGLDYGYYLYTMDDGTTQFNVRIQKSIGTNADFGFAAFDAAKPVRKLYNKRAGISARHILAISATTGNRRKVAVGTHVCDIWTGTADTFDLPIRGSATAETFSVTHKVGESDAPAHAVYNL